MQAAVSFSALQDPKLITRVEHPLPIHAILFHWSEKNAIQLVDPKQLTKTFYLKRHKKAQNHITRCFHLRL